MIVYVALLWQLRLIPMTLQASPLVYKLCFFYLNQPRVESVALTDTKVSERGHRAQGETERGEASAHSQVGLEATGSVKLLQNNHTLNMIEDHSWSLSCESLSWCGCPML